MGDDDCLDLGPPAVQEGGVWQDFLHAQVREAAQHANRTHHLLSEYLVLVLRLSTRASS